MDRLTAWAIDAEQRRQIVERDLTMRATKCRWWFYQVREFSSELEAAKQGCVELQREQERLHSEAVAAAEKHSVSLFLLDSRVKHLLEQLEKERELSTKLQLAMEALGVIHLKWDEVGEG